MIAAARHRLIGLAAAWAMLGYPALPTAPAARQDLADHSPATQSTSLDEAIVRLSDPDFSQRESASHQLWLAGKAAAPLLKEAAKSDDPETAERARAILKKFELGLFPDTPQDIIDLLDQFRAGDLPAKLKAVDALSGRGIRASRLLLGLRRDEKNPQLKQAILKALTAHAHDAAALLVADGEAAVAEEILIAANDGDAATRDYTALLLLQGRLDGRIADLKSLAARPDATFDTATQLAYAARATGDLSSAHGAAQRAIDITTAASEENNRLAASALFEAILVEQQDWPALSKRLQQRLAQPDGDPELLEDLSYAAGYARLAGDSAAFDKSTAALEDYADKHGTESWQVAKALFLNDRPDAAVALLLKFHNFLLAEQFLPARLQYAQTLELPALALAAGESPRAISTLKARIAETMRLVGDGDGARKIIGDIANGNVTRGDFETWVALVEVSRSLGDRASVDAFIARALRIASPRDDVQQLLSKAAIREPALLARWWTQLRREKDSREDIDTSIKNFLPLAHGKLLGDDLASIEQRTEQWAGNTNSEFREQALDLVVQTLRATGHDDQAAALLARWARTWASPQVLMKLGDMRAGAHQFRDAAAAYSDAWEMDHSQPVPLYLQGWALAQDGDTSHGQPLMKLADTIALAAEEPRYALFQAMTSHGCDADADRERDLILRLSGFGAWERCEVLRVTGDRANGHGDYATAATLWEQAFLPNLGSNRSFYEPWANVMIPALIHHTRSLALIHKGDIPAAMREADACMNDSPGDVDALIDITCALQTANHLSEADTVFGRMYATYEKLLATYPNSGPINNLIAWGEARTGRRLDDAVAHARRAVELEPNNTASIDTLAEALFVHGDTPGAIAAIQRCIDLEPDAAHHRQQMERFHAAQTQPTTRPAGR